MAETIHIHNYAGGEGGPTDTPGREVLRVTPNIDNLNWGFPQDVNQSFPMMSFNVGKTYVVYELDD
jgi:hypothetical protein